MKTLFTLLLAALAFVATAQPQKIHYQGVAVGANGKPIKNSTIGLRLSVLDSLPTGTTLYTETQTASTDAAGQFSIYLGAGTATAGTFANLPWANGNDKFLKVEMDAQGGNNYQPMGTTQLVSVPYAMAAGTSNLISDQFGNSITIKYDGNGNPYIALVPKPIPGCGQFILYAGESYPTIQIGMQCWFVKNLNVGTMIFYTTVQDSQRNNGILEKYCYNNDSVNCNTYGGLYQWAEAVQYQNGASNLPGTLPNPLFLGNVQGICPSGWHIPSEEDFKILEVFLGGYQVAGSALKSTSQLWGIGNVTATNKSSFSALPAGYLSSWGSNFGGLGYSAWFLHSTVSSYYLLTRALIRDLVEVHIDLYPLDGGYSVRCLKD